MHLQQTKPGCLFLYFFPLRFSATCVWSIRQRAGRAASTTSETSSCSSKPLEDSGQLQKRRDGVGFWEMWWRIAWGHRGWRGRCSGSITEAPPLATWPPLLSGRCSLWHTPSVKDERFGKTCPKLERTHTPGWVCLHLCYMDENQTVLLNMVLNSALLFISRRFDLFHCLISSSAVHRGAFNPFQRGVPVWIVASLFEWDAPLVLTLSSWYPNLLLWRSGIHLCGFFLSADTKHTIQEPQKTSCLPSVSESGCFPVTGRNDISL